MPLKVSDAEFLTAWRETNGSPKRVSELLGIDISGVHARRRRIEDRTGAALHCPDPRRRGGQKGAGVAKLEAARKQYEQRMTVEARGVVLVMSDAHYWPGVVTVAHQAFVTLCRELKPVAVVANGDILDGCTISRHERIGWEQQPKLRDEIAAVQDRLGEIERVAKGAPLIRTVGNHDVRYERFLANNASQYEDVLGVSLLDHLPAWRAGWSLWVNGHTVIKHRMKGGIHAIYNNAMRSGLSIVTGHLHALNVRAYSDYTGTRFGVDTGTLAEPDGPQFGYTEDDSKDWRSGFAVLTFDNRGRLLPPELCMVMDGVAYFRGKPV